MLRLTKALWCFLAAVAITAVLACTTHYLKDSWYLDQLQIWLAVLLMLFVISGFLHIWKANGDSMRWVLGKLHILHSGGNWVDGEMDWKFVDNYRSPMPPVERRIRVQTRRCAVCNKIKERRVG